MTPKRPKAAALPTEGGTGAAPWVDFADAALLGAAVGRRAQADPDRFAGLRINSDEAARIVAELGSPQPFRPFGDPEATIDAARDAFHRSLKADDAFSGLARRADLDPVSCEVLAVVAAVELDPRRQRLVAYLQDDVSRPRPTLHLIHTLLGDQGLAALAEHRLLRVAGLVELVGDGPFASRVVAVAPMVLWGLLDEAGPDPDMPPGATLLRGGEPVVTDDLPVLIAAGPDRTRRIQAVIGEAGPGPIMTTPMPDSDRQWDAIVRTSAVLGVSLVVVEIEDAVDDRLRRRVERTGHVHFALTSPRPIDVLDLPQRAWIELTPADALVVPTEISSVLGEGARDLVAGHRLTADQLLALGRTMPAVDDDTGRAVRRIAAGRLERLARRVRAKRQWSDLVLVPQQEQQMRELIGRYRERDIVHGEWGVPAVPAAGVLALFSGPSGTGKTTAAELIAHELDLDLFVIDLSAVVSKYIGETERNLEQIFAAASTGNMVLLFDEADALFGTRSAISDARDRYANMEVSYLLQRVETYDGVVILTTNMSRNLDAAFFRRIHVAIDFGQPKGPERILIWKKWLDIGAPLEDDIDVAFLGDRIEVPGGIIRNACVGAAFLAASDRSAIGMRHVLLALRREMEKIGRLCTPEDFGPWYALLEEASLPD